MKSLELNGFKSFARKSEFIFDVPIIAIVGPNGSGKSNIVESIRFVLGEQSVKSMRGKTGSDLIFKGSNSISKMSRASVNIVFDNTDRVFHLHHHNNAKINIDFNEVVISREVFADGGNKYKINGHEVRMKDVHELIASVNIGTSGHHIISQGEADRYLNANIKDRRELIEEALGLKVYQYRLKESLRKLDRSEKNMRESEMLRRELAPHLRFLKRQVDKIEKAKHLRTDLAESYKIYFSKEDYLIRDITESIESEKTILNERFSAVNTFLSSHQNPDNVSVYTEEKQIIEKKSFIEGWQEKISLNTRELGKIEGMISLLEKQELDSKKPVENKTKKHPGFSYDQVKNFFIKITKSLNLLKIENIDAIVSDIKSELDVFVKIENATVERNIVDNSIEITELNRKKQILIDATTEAQNYIAELSIDISKFDAELLQKRSAERESQKHYYEHVAVKKELEGKKELLAEKIHSLNGRITSRNEEYNEAVVLIGESEIQYQQTLVDEDNAITEITQEQSRRLLERSKIRLEDMGGGSGIETLKEYEDTMKRDEFLAKEITDITETIESLHSVITDLKQTLNTEFDAGVKKINVQFDKFFKLMFGGGDAELVSSLVKKRSKKRVEGEQLELIEDEENKEKEYGIDIKVKLPRKKITDLEMLSGGERSLTSIALLFALSQVNPPPFLVLDETDAALDEANSQRYGDMVEQLSKYSQLIVVTHNRETMSRAQTLFGVTLGRDDASTMLSLRLEDAEKYAK
ncbi:MAG: AAA family ATPase [Candidatus Pacebacteria bacterium]|nr:AAA family ATPase [Candidatus Paceibacterota bacterium]